MVYVSRTTLEWKMTCTSQRERSLTLRKLSAPKLSTGSDSSQCTYQRYPKRLSKLSHCFICDAMDASQRISCSLTDLQPLVKIIFRDPLV